VPYKIVEDAVTFDVSNASDGHSYLKPLSYATVMRTCTSSALAEAVTPVPTLSRGPFWRCGAVLRSLNSLAFAVHVSSIVRAIHFVRVWFGIACSGRSRVRWSWRLCLRSDLLRKQNRG
jgi:hypothetical protein